MELFVSAGSDAALAGAADGAAVAAFCSFAAFSDEEALSLTALGRFFCRNEGSAVFGFGRGDTPAGRAPESVAAMELTSKRGVSVALSEALAS
mmetsp:Transcript_1078/g.2465  ORF Transcript_1078/g.2465 Transcript_1078/m.2465 type:complete len:93 (-) Transcript_1078:105-383(-)